jgi:hypothetical protein
VHPPPASARAAGAGKLARSGETVDGPASYAEKRRLGATTMKPILIILSFTLPLFVPLSASSAVFIAPEAGTTISQGHERGRGDAAVEKKGKKARKHKDRGDEKKG